MGKQRIDRLNSLLREVISEVIRKEVRNPNVSELVTVMRVDITKDLKNAKIFVSIIGEDKVRQETLKALNSAAGFIGIHASKKVVLRFFPTLKFILDVSVDHQMRIEELLKHINDERKQRDDG